MNQAAARGGEQPNGEGALELSFCLASLRSGLLLGKVGDPSLRERFEGLASTIPELFGTIDEGALTRIAERSAGEVAGSAWNEMLLLSDGYVHLVQPLASQPGVALLAVSPRVGGIGLLLSEFHARVAALEAP